MRESLKKIRPVREDLVTQACLEAYGAIRHENRMADRSIEFTLRRKEHLYSNERRAVAEHVYALLRQQVTVDFLLQKGRTGFSALSSGQQDALRFAASRVLAKEDVHTVLQCTGIPSSELHVFQGFTEALSKLDQAPRAERLSVRYSLPLFVAEQFIKEFKESAEKEADSLNVRAPLCIRVNGLKLEVEDVQRRLKQEGVDTERTALSNLGLILQSRNNVFSSPAFRDGLFEIQDEGSQVLGMLVDCPPTKVIDACAGAGGKTLQLAAQMKNRGDLFAFDVDDKRLHALKLRARRANAHNIRIQVIPKDAAPEGAVFESLKGQAHRVLVDAPCTGSGTFRRKPEARYRLTQESVTEHATRQKEILARMAPFVRVGGRLIYGTCSVFREENEQVAEDFLKNNSAFELLPIERVLPKEVAEKVSVNGMLRTSTYRHGTDGFFGAIFERKK